MRQIAIRRQDDSLDSPLPHHFPAARSFVENAVENADRRRTIFLAIAFLMTTNAERDRGKFLHFAPIFGVDFFQSLIRMACVDGRKGQHQLTVADPK
jgi:hypothetical protein